MIAAAILLGAAMIAGAILYDGALRRAQQEQDRLAVVAEIRAFTHTVGGLIGELRKATRSTADSTAGKKTYSGESLIRPTKRNGSWMGA